MTKRMKPVDFRKRLYSLLVDAGYRITKGGAVKDSPDVRVIVSAGVDAKDHALTVTFGLSIKSAGGSPPEYYNHSHIYGGTGNLTASLQALDLGLYGKSPDAMKAYLDAVPHDLVPALSKLFDVVEVAEALRRGMFSRCLVRKEARSYLSGLLAT